MCKMCDIIHLKFKFHCGTYVCEKNLTKQLHRYINALGS
jgi:hypothetical protein